MTKISDMMSGQPAQTGDLLVIARGAANFKLDIGELSAFVLNSAPPFSLGLARFMTAGSSPLIVPAGVTTMYATSAAGGGGGGGDDGTSGAGGGGAGEATLMLPLTVLPNETLTIVRGAGGLAGAANSPGGTGGSTTITGSVSGLLLTLLGGEGGYPAGIGSPNAQRGGAPGGAGAQAGQDNRGGDFGGNGGSNIAGGIGGALYNIRPDGSPLTSAAALGGGGSGSSSSGAGSQPGGAGFVILAW